MLDKLSTLPVLFNQLTISSQVPGAQFTLYHNGQLIELATGVEHIHLGTPVTTRSRFAPGSVSKVATATVVMQMLEDDDSVSTTQWRIICPAPSTAARTPTQSR